MTFSIKYFLHRRLRVLTLLVAIFYVFSKIPGDYILLDLLDHFQFYYQLWFFLSLLLAVFIFRDKSFAIGAAFFLCFSLLVTFYPLASHIALSSRKVEGLPPNSFPVKIVSANVLASNSNYDAIEKMIREEDPDILVIAELTILQVQALGPFLDSHYAYKFIRPIDYPCGIGLYSKFPLNAAKFIDPARDVFGYISASVQIHGKSYNLLAVHPFPPLFQTGFINRNLVYKDLPRGRIQKSGETIVIGDFNNTIWSPYLQELMQSLEVKADLLAPATWPTAAMVPGIGIDNILIPQDANFISIRRAADIGSDHYPLMAEIAL